MRVLLVVGSYFPELQFGGSTQKIYELSLGLIARGHEVEVVTFHSDQSVPHPQTVMQGVTVSYLPWKGRGAWRVPLRFAPLVAAIKRSEVVHCFGLYSLLCAAAALNAKRLKRPYLIEPMGMYIPRGRQLLMKRIYNALCSSWMLSGAAKVIATSQTEFTELAASVPNNKLTIRHDGIRVETFSAAQDGKLFRKSLGIGESESLILYVGRISRIKNLEQLILAFKLAHLEHARLVLVGPMDEPDYLAKLKRLIETEDLTGKVLLTGPLYENAKLPAYAAANLFVLPSKYESYGIAAAEAVAAGVPVLITETCGIAPTINLRAGLSVPVNVTSIAKGMRTLLTPTECETFIQQRPLVLKELTWEKPLDQLERLYMNAKGSGNDLREVLAPAQSI